MYKNPCYISGSFQPVAESVRGWGSTGQLLTSSFEDLQAWCMAQPPRAQQSLSLFVRHLKHSPTTRATVNRSTSSYGLKHVVERFSDSLGNHEYISNEDLIIALVQAGFIAEQTNPRGCRPGPNYYFNLTAGALKSFKEGRLYCDLVN